METFYFGDSSRLMFGAYHPARETRDRGVGVVLCYPILNEYLRAHRAFVRLATLLASEGFHVLRFDYFGCGDSYGGAEDASLTQWTENVSTAIDELKNGCDASHICLIGLRMGATLALLAAEGRDDVDSLVLWESIVNGEAYIRDIQQASLAYEKVEGIAREAKGRADDQDGLDILGFRVSGLLLEELEKLDLLRIQQCPANKILHLRNCDDYDRTEFLIHLKELRADVEERNISCASIWLEADNESYAGLVPANALQDIVQWVSERHS